MKQSNHAGGARSRPARDLPHRARDLPRRARGLPRPARDLPKPLPLAGCTLLLAAVHLSAGAQQPAPAPPAEVIVPGSGAVAQAAGKPERTLGTVEVKGEAMRGDTAPYSVNEIDRESVREAAVPTPESLLNRVPGVSVNNYNLGGVANVISMRGFSNGAHGGGIGFMIDGIPLNEALSHADGYADMNVLIPLELESVTVYKGPTSALYGNFNRAGLIDFRSRKAGAYTEADLSAGSYSTLDAQGAYGGKLGSGQFNGAAQLYRSDGFRPDSQYGKGTVAARYSLPVGERLELAVSGRAHEGSWDSASYLTAGQFAADPYGKDPRVVNDGGDKTFYTARLDANYALSDSLQLLSFVYGTRQTFNRLFTRPVSAVATANWRQREEDYDRDVTGAGVNLNGRKRLASGELNWVAGVETYAERTGYDQLDGLTAGSRAGATVTNDRTYRFDSDAVFGQAEWVPTRLFRPTLGLRYDRFTGNCTRNGAETSTDPCSRMQDLDLFSPKVGVRSTVARGVDLRASYSEGYALPDGAAKFGTGSEVRPNDLRQTEIGITLTPARAVRADVGVYRLLSSNEIRAVSPGVFENFGATRRTGVEASLSWLPGLWEFTLAAATANSRVTENANAALIGKEVTGVPERTATAIVAYRPSSGWGAFGAARYVGGYAVNAANTAFGDSYTTVDLGVSYTSAAGWLSRYRLYAALANAFDKRYAANEFLIGGQELFAPGAPRTVSVGVQMTF